jgi:hypothetical protein
MVVRPIRGNLGCFGTQIFTRKGIAQAVLKYGCTLRPQSILCPKVFKTVSDPILAWTPLPETKGADEPASLDGAAGRYTPLRISLVEA